MNLGRCAKLRQCLGIQNWPKRIIKFAVVGGIIRHQVNEALPEA